MSELDSLPPPSTLDELPPPSPMDLRNASLPDILWQGGKQLVGGAAHGVGTLVDVATGTPPGQGSHAEEFASNFATEPTLQDEEQRQLKEKVSKGYDVAFGRGPLATTLKERLPQAAEAISTVTAPLGLKGAKVDTAIQQGHPLSAAAQAEADRMQGHISTAKSQGLDLSPREVSPAQTYVDNAARRDLNLPGNSPVTSGILDAADKSNVSPHYAAAQKFDPQLVEASQQGRSVARGLYEDADNMNLTFAQRSAARKEAQTNYQAAKDAEAQFRAKATAAGHPELADNWDAARVYKAKLETWRDALQGGVEGHVNGLRIRKLGLADEPLSGAQAEAASVAAQHPDQFTSGVAAQRPGPIGRLIKKAAPVAGAAIGGAVAPGVIGPMVGAELAGSLADRVIR